MYARYLASQVKHNGYLLAGVVVGMCVALVVVPPAGVPHGRRPLACGEGAGDDVQPAREAQEAREAAHPPPRPLQRPRYYSTELGIRARALAAVLSSEQALGGCGAALNASAAGVLPLKFFMTASSLGTARRLPNVVGFTDTREMLKPFHMLKYLADNYLEEYDFFFLMTDTAFLNARRLLEMLRHLSVSEDLYMGAPADEDGHYCSLDKGILLSNSVLRRMHSSLDWCVRNSYSGQHHENLGRCVLHSAQLKCTQTAQGQRYLSASLAEGQDWRGVPEAVTAHPAPETATVHQLRALAARAGLRQARDEVRALRRQLTQLLPRHPPGYRNATWPGGLRSDAGLAPPPPDTRHDHLRWTRFNATHALMPDERVSAAPLPRAHREAVQAVLGAARRWAETRWPGLVAEASEGLWRWEPARGLYYRVTLRLRPRAAPGPAQLRQVEVCRPLGPARLLSLPYVTESARVSVLLPLLLGEDRDYAGFLQRYRAVCLQRDRKTSLTIVLVNDGANVTESQRVRAAAAAVGAGDGVAVWEWAPSPAAPISTAPSSPAGRQRRRWEAARWAAGRLPRDALVLLARDHMEFNEDFLNRVRMNTLRGVQWYSPLPFARYAQYAHPQFLDPDGHKPQTNTGHFDQYHEEIVSFYRQDLDDALALAAGTAAEESAARALARGPLHCLRAPEPGLVLQPPPSPPCPRAPDCLRDVRHRQFRDVHLGNRHALVNMMLQMGVL